MRGLSMVQRQILVALESSARERGYSTLQLETGTRQPEAIKLYRSAGYCEIPCFGDYADGQFSVCFEKRLAWGAIGEHAAVRPVAADTEPLDCTLIADPWRRGRFCGACNLKFCGGRLPCRFESDPRH
jgi:hypothetical protein